MAKDYAAWLNKQEQTKEAAVPETKHPFAEFLIGIAEGKLDQIQGRLRDPKNARLWRDLKDFDEDEPVDGALIHGKGFGYEFRWKPKTVQIRSRRWVALKTDGAYCIDHLKTAGAYCLRHIEQESEQAEVETYGSFVAWFEDWQVVDFEVPA